MLDSKRVDGKDECYANRLLGEIVLLRVVQPGTVVCTELNVRDIHNKYVNSSKVNDRLCLKVVLQHQDDHSFWIK